MAKKFGDRKDGAKLRNIHAMHLVMPLMYPNRCDNEAFISERIDLTNVLAYLDEKNASDPDYKYNFFQVMVTIMLKVITLRPKMNRFIANKTMYQRNEVSAAFTVKKEFSDDGGEALAYILSRDLNVAATDAYIERLLEAKTAPESEQQKTFILKDVRVFLNTISHSLDLMKQGGIDAGMRRQETDEALILTINIPKARRREPAPKQAEPVPVG